MLCHNWFAPSNMGGDHSPQLRVIGESLPAQCGVMYLWILLIRRDECAFQPCEIVEQALLAFAQAFDPLSRVNRRGGSEGIATTVESGIGASSRMAAIVATAVGISSKFG